MVYDSFIVDEPPQDAHEALKLHNRIWTLAARTSLAHGGVLNEHHGIGLKLGRLMREQYGSAWPTLEAIKQALDPRGIMNPGKQGYSLS
jgi:alkyldihydroxyacetonephosphate synthase